MDWTDGWMPRWQFAEVHHIRSRASPAALLDAAQARDPDDDPLLRVALGLRESPGRLGDEALAYGLIGRFWEPGYGLLPQADAAAFRAFQGPGVAKLLLAFEARADGDASRITTLSRLVCADAPTRRRMALYWTLIRPVSGLIRRRLLAQIKRVAEA